MRGVPIRYPDSYNKAEFECEALPDRLLRWLSKRDVTPGWPDGKLADAARPHHSLIAKTDPGYVGTTSDRPIARGLLKTECLA